MKHRNADHGLTPVETYWSEDDGRSVLFLKREDAIEGGGKARFALALGAQAKAEGASILVSAGSRHSPMVARVAKAAQQLGMQARVHVASGPDTDMTLAAIEAGAEVIRHRPGYTTVIWARAREDVAGWHGAAVLVPFGLEHPLALRLVGEQVDNLPLGGSHQEVRRVVVPVGSGMTMAGILSRLAPHVPVLGVQVGADPIERLDRWAPFWRTRAELVPSGLPYATHVDAPLWPAWVPAAARVALDPVYEAKVVPFLEPGDLLWIVGNRA